jgi:hypothetical protein
MEMKPCPFCGEHLEEQDCYPGWLWHPDNECILANAQVDLDGHGALCIDKNDTTQIDQWNKRA